MESHDSEVISLAYSAVVPTKKALGPNAAKDANGQTPIEKPRYLLASGGRDKLVHVYDSEKDYEAFTVLDHHASTITALQFNEYSTAVENKSRLSNPSYERNIELVTSSADKNLITKNLDLGRFKIFANDLLMAGDDTENPLFKLNKSQICKDKILSLDVAQQA